MSEKVPENEARKVAVMTGAASGIGYATAKLFLESGWFVYLSDVNEESLAKAAASLASFKANLATEVVDVRSSEALEKFAAKVFEERKNVHLLFNNAGVGQVKPIVQTTAADWDHVLDINLRGVVYGIAAFLPKMKLQDSESHIINTASILGLISMNRMAPYCASKFAVVGLSESMDLELRRQGIRVSALCPGAVRTNIARAGVYEIPGVDSERAIRNFEKQGMSPDKVAAVVLRAVQKRRGGQLIIAGPLRPLYWLRSFSTGIYRRAAEWLDGFMSRRLKPR